MPDVMCGSEFVLVQECKNARTLLNRGGQAANTAHVAILCWPQ